MNDNGGTKTKSHNNGGSKISVDSVERLFDDGYRDIEILKDGTIRERSPEGDVTDEFVTRSLKTGRTWY
jgi:hypothetical protein